MKDIKNKYMDMVRQVPDDKQEQSEQDLQR